MEEDFAVDIGLYVKWQCCDPHRLVYCHCHAQQCISIDFATPNFSFNCLCIAAIPSLCFVTCMAKLWPNKFHGAQLFFLPFLHLVTPSEIQFSWGELLQLSLPIGHSRNFSLLSSNRWSNLSVPKAHQRGEIIGRKRKNGVVTCVAKCFANYSMAPFQIPCTI